MVENRTSITVRNRVRDELRRYKAQDGLSYDEAIAQLLEGVGWIDDSNDLVGED